MILRCLLWCFDVHFHLQIQYDAMSESWLEDGVRLHMRHLDRFPPHVLTFGASTLL